MNWQPTSAPPLAWTRVTCSADGSKITAGALGDGASIPNGAYSSTNHGATWFAKDTILTNSIVLGLNGVASSADGNWLVGGSGDIFINPPPGGGGSRPPNVTIAFVRPASVVVSWPATASSTLQQNLRLSPTNWITTTYPITTANGANHLTITAPKESLFLPAARGAGRAMSRTAANEKFNWKDLNRFLNQQGVTLISSGLDEVPMAYKNIREIMAAQNDLVTVLGQFDPKLVKMAPSANGRKTDGSSGYFRRSNATARSNRSKVSLSNHDLYGNFGKCNGCLRKLRVGAMGLFHIILRQRERSQIIHQRIPIFKFKILHPPKV